MEKKPSLAIAIGVPKGGAPMDDAPDDDGDDDGGDLEQGKLDSAQALIDAIKKGDAQAVSDALTTHAGLSSASAPPEEEG